MKRLDPRSVIIGFLLALTCGLTMALTQDKGSYESLEVNNLRIRNGGGISFAPTNGKSLLLNSAGIKMLDVLNPQQLNLGIDSESQNYTIYVSSLTSGNTTIVPGVFMMEATTNDEIERLTLMQAGEITLAADQKARSYLGYNENGDGLIVLFDKYDKQGWAHSGKN